MRYCKGAVVLVSLGAFACGGGGEDAIRVGVAREALTTIGENRFVATGPYGAGHPGVAIIEKRFLVGFHRAELGGDQSGWAISDDFGSSWTVHWSDEPGFAWGVPNGPQGPGVMSDGTSFQHYDGSPIVLRTNHGLPGETQHAVYLTFAIGDGGPAHVDIAAAVSLDGGATWRNPYLVTTPESGVVLWGSFDAVYSPASGAIWVTWKQRSQVYPYTDHVQWIRRIWYDGAELHLDSPPIQVDVSPYPAIHGGVSIGVLPGSEPAWDSVVLAWADVDDAWHTGWNCNSGPPTARTNWYVGLRTWNGDKFIGPWLVDPIDEDDEWPRCAGGVTNFNRPSLVTSGDTWECYLAYARSTSSGARVHVRRTVGGAWQPQAITFPAKSGTEQWGPTLALMHVEGADWLGLSWRANDFGNPAAEGIRGAVSTTAAASFSAGPLSLVGSQGGSVPWTTLSWWHRGGAMVGDPATGVFLAAWSDLRLGPDSYVFATRFAP